MSRWDFAGYSFFLIAQGHSGKYRELRWISFLVLPQHRKKEKDWFKLRSPVNPERRCFIQVFQGFTSNEDRFARLYTCCTHGSPPASFLYAASSSAASSKEMTDTERLPLRESLLRGAERVQAIGKYPVYIATYLVYPEAAFLEVAFP
ncbi:hypothetical protein ACFE04_019620 [Oxalis oulophora]